MVSYEIRLPMGILGFGPWKNYLLIVNPAEEPFRRLQVKDNPSLAFVVVEPFLVVPHYYPTSRNPTSTVGILTLIPLPASIRATGVGNDGPANVCQIIENRLIDCPSGRTRIKAITQVLFLHNGHHAAQ
jgi:flagellar assembly factor FliW